MVTTRPWNPRYTHRLTRRRLLAGAASGAAAAALIACGGAGDNKGGKLSPTIDPESARKPGAIWYSRNNWQLGDETAQAVPGGVYPGRASEDVAATFDPMLATSGPLENFID